MSLTLKYDSVGDILYITKVPPFREQESEEVDDCIIARFNPTTDEVEGLEILFWSKRLASGEPLILPVTADLRLAV